MRDSMVSALCGLKMVFGSADETHDGCTYAIATTNSWERALARQRGGDGGLE